VPSLSNSLIFNYVNLASLGRAFHVCHMASSWWILLQR